MVTQCPACGTRFRITDSQLGRAGGKVRCGACLEIFLAPDSPGSDEQAPPGAAADGGNGGIAGREGNGQGAVQRHPGKQAATAGKAAGTGRSEYGKAQSAPKGAGSAWWVRWALVVAVLVLILQVVGHLA